MTDEIVGIVGDLNWSELRKFMVIELLKCENEIDFLDFLNTFVKSMGNKKQLTKIRKKLNIKPFSEKDEKLMKRLKIR